jgi:DNA-3-methyladenine glycosylase II
MDAFLARIQTGVKHLTQADPFLAALNEKLGPCDWRNYRQTPFYALIRAVIAQQLSTHAAAAIERRVLALLPEDVSDWPALIPDLAEESLRQAGLSHAKIRTLKLLSEYVVENPEQFADLNNQPDESVQKTICHIRGIGPWTAEMFLMFGLQRLDVFSGADLGLRKAIQLLYQLADRPTAQDCVKRAETWKPYRTVAAWYLWRIVD